MHNLVIHKNKDIKAKKCEQCFSLFIHEDELNTLLENVVSNIYYENYARLFHLSRITPTKGLVKNYNCPECNIVLSKENYARNSNIHVDRCQVHGILFEAGELKQLFEWTKAGGLISFKNLVKKENNLKKKQKGLGRLIDITKSKNKQRDHKIRKASFIELILSFTGMLGLFIFFVGTIKNNDGFVLWGLLGFIIPGLLLRFMEHTEEVFTKKEDKNGKM